MRGPCRPELHGGAERRPRSVRGFPTFADRGYPGGTVGTTTGRLKGLNPFPPATSGRGVAPAGGSKEIAAAGARRAPISFAEHRTAFARRPPPPRLQEARSAARRDRDGKNVQTSEPTARENEEVCRPCECRDPVITDALALSHAPAITGCPVGAGHQRVRSLGLRCTAVALRWLRKTISANTLSPA